MVHATIAAVASITLTAMLAPSSSPDSPLHSPDPPQRRAQCVLERTSHRCTLWFDDSPRDGRVQHNEHGEIWFDPTERTLWFDPPETVTTSPRRSVSRPIAQNIDGVTFSFDDVDPRFSRRLIVTLLKTKTSGGPHQIGIWLADYRFPGSSPRASARKPDAGSPTALIRSASVGSGAHAYLTP
jgi:hypothetical protein